MKNNKKGFTLVELVIVIAVIAILAGVLIGTFATVISSANKSKALQEWKATVDEAYVEFMAENHEVPGSVLVDTANKTIKFDKKTKGTYVILPENGQGYIELDSSIGIYLSWNKGAYSVTTSNSDIGNKLTETVAST